MPLRKNILHSKHNWITVRLIKVVRESYPKNRRWLIVISFCIVFMSIVHIDMESKKTKHTCEM